MTKIGLEIHIQLENCSSKLFCPCSTKKSSKPNTFVCPICLGMPGSKPAINEKAIFSTLKAALALNFTINSPTFFSRKTYFFPDLAKNYQITQFETPIGIDGSFLDIKLNRIHLEEDPASLVHNKTNVLVDYNRSGIPLLEVVTAPSIKSGRQARRFVQELTRVMEYLGIYTKQSHASLRCDVNVSVPGGKRVEIKNIGSAYDIEHAIRYELSLQTKKPTKVQQTKGWNSKKKQTYIQRTKETESDYGYITEPDLPTITFDHQTISKAKTSIPRLATDRVEYYIKTYRISIEDAKTLVAEQGLADLFESTAAKVDPRFAARWIRREVVRVLRYKKKSLDQTKLNSTHLIQIIKAIKLQKITVRTGQKFMEELVKKPFDVKNRISQATSNTKDELTTIIKSILKSNLDVVKDYRSGNLKSLHFLIGQVMKKTKGTADPSNITITLKKLIKEA
ncbi:Asp-tRNA(Asn)/Glu-tRNA(Gln) amidotransferase GatCAB subunit B [archaeon]|nr:Asp-tRNA(Asn)/Glu-tRNA(Gln) amidotransferase GatCAB subunit B [archaeon]